MHYFPLLKIVDVFTFPLSLFLSLLFSSLLFLPSFAPHTAAMSKDMRGLTNFISDIRACAFVYEQRDGKEMKILGRSFWKRGREGERRREGGERDGRLSVGLHRKRE
jgi:hypothetical protein